MFPMKICSSKSSQMNLYVYEAGTVSELMYIGFGSVLSFCFKKKVLFSPKKTSPCRKYPDRNLSLYPIVISCRQQL